MKILLVNYEFPPLGGGAANASWFIGKAMVELGHEVTVLTSGLGSLKGYFNESGMDIYRLSTGRRQKDCSGNLEKLAFLLLGLLKLPNIIKKKKLHGLVVFFTIPCGPLGWVGKIIDKIPYVISLRGGDVPGLVPEINWIHNLLKPIRRATLRSAIAVIANSDGLKAMSEEADPILVKVISNGVDSDFFCPIKEKQISRAFQFLFVGRFQSQKNLYYLLNNLNHLSQTSSIPFTVKFVGDGPLKNQVVEYAESLEIANKIEWVGWCHKLALRTHYQQADCFLNPSLYEGMPNTVLEAMACGLPVIASNVLGNNELVGHDETGYLFNLDLPDDFQNSLKDILDNPEKARRFGLAGRHCVEKEYSWRRVAQEYVALFNS